MQKTFNRLSSTPPTADATCRATQMSSAALHQLRISQITDQFKSRAAGRLAAVAMTAVLSASNAWAYHPFDGTDAAVAEESVFELEAGLGQVHVGDVDRLALPSLVFNHGLPYDTEIELEGQVNHEVGSKADVPRNSLGDTALSMKHVFVHGRLRDGTGPSVAVECAVLLPEVHGSSGTGGECAAIASNKWDWRHSSITSYCETTC